METPEGSPEFPLFARAKERYSRAVRPVERAIAVTDRMYELSINPAAMAVATALTAAAVFPLIVGGYMLLDDRTLTEAVGSARALMPPFGALWAVLTVPLAVSFLSALALVRLKRLVARTAARRATRGLEAGGLSLQDAVWSLGFQSGVRPTVTAGVYPVAPWAQHVVRAVVAALQDAGTPCRRMTQLASMGHSAWRHPMVAGWDGRATAFADLAEALSDDAFDLAVRLFASSPSRSRREGRTGEIAETLMLLAERELDAEASATALRFVPDWQGGVDDLVKVCRAL